jgi:hypothetical protein
MALHPWPGNADEYGWAIELAEELLEETEQSPEELRGRARELRKEAKATDIEAYRDVRLAPADRYDEVAVSRLADARA